VTPAARGARRFLVLVSAAAGCAPSPPQKPDIQVGVLLPFSGSLAHAGYNIERALFLAADRINEAGGINGKTIGFVEKDTRSTVTAGLAAATELLGDEGIPIVIGPEEEDLARKMFPLVTKHNAIQLLPGLTSPTLGGLDAPDGYWFRLGVSAQVVGASLADRLIKDGVKRASAFASEDDYSSAVGSAFTNQFRSAGGLPGPVVSFAPDQTVFARELGALAAFKPQSVALIGFPKAAASIVEAWSTGANTYNWYFSPTLESQAFVENVVPGVLDGMVGIAPQLSADAADFTKAFAAKNSGDVPMPGSHAYYDAVILLGLALQAATVAGGAAPTVEQIRVQLRSVAGPPGVKVGWNQVTEALSMVSQGTDIWYQGLSGSLDFDVNGNVSDTDQAVSFWTLHGDKLVELD
jgi:branched-chain amino acid transport system substrate-binding protein